MFFCFHLQEDSVCISVLKTKIQWLVFLTPPDMHCLTSVYSSGGASGQFHGGVIENCLKHDGVIVICPAININSD